MAKILDALKSADVASLPAPKRVSVEAVKPVPAAPQPEEAEQVPYIEVGGPNRQVDASPDVLGTTPIPVQASRPTASPVRLVEARSPGSSSESPISLTPAETSPLVAVYQPWPFQPAVSSRLDLEQELVVLHQPEHPTSRQYFGLLDQMLGGENRPQVLLFTALATEQGATTVLLNLALAASRSGEQKVAVVDANWKSPGLASRLGLPPGPGLQEVIAGSVALEQALRTPAAGNLQVLSGHSWSGREFGLGGSEALRWVIRWLRGRFDLIFLDVPVWEESQEFFLLLALSDAVFPVIQESRIVQPRLQHMIQTLTHSGAHVRGVIHANLLTS